jgi:hypothetical protein
MRRRKVRTNYGDLIVAVTDKVAPFIEDPSTMYRVVSCIVSDLLTHDRMRRHQRLWRRYPAIAVNSLKQTKPKSRSTC